MNLWQRIQLLFGRKRFEHELDDELRFHLDAQIEANIRAGMSPREARRQALLELGGMEQVKEQVRVARPGFWMETLWQDLRFGARMLRKKPGFTAVAVLTLALGIGANTAIFSVVYSVLLQPLPYRDPGRVFAAWQTDQRNNVERNPVSPANFLDWHARTADAFEALGAISPYGVDYFADGEPEILPAALLTPDVLPALGTDAFLGRTFRDEDYVRSQAQAVLLNYGFWQRRFGGDPAVVGRTLTLSDAPYTVVGVLPPDFRLPLYAGRDVYLPLIFWPGAAQQRRATFLGVVGKLKSGITPEQGQAALARVARQLAAENPADNAGVGVNLVSVSDQLVGPVRPALWVLLGAVGFILLIACANVANLLLARGSERQRELAIRTALGAGRSRILRQLLTESLLLSLAGCALGLLLASWSLGAVVSLAPANIPRIGQVRLNLPVLGFAAGLSVATALLFGLLPSFLGSRKGLQHSLKEGLRGTSGSARHRMRSVLAVAEISLALVLLVGAGLLARSFAALVNVDPGFRPQNLAALQVYIYVRYQTPKAWVAYFEDALDHLRATPGVVSAAVSSTAPYVPSSVTNSLPIVVEGQPAPAPGQEPTAARGIASGDYFRTLGVPLLRGRTFTPFDDMDAPRVAVINESMARRYWPGQDAVGRMFSLVQRDPVTYQVIGVVGDVRATGLDTAPQPEFFESHAQNPSGGMIFVVRTQGDPAASMDAIKSAIWKTNPNQPFYSVSTVEGRMDRSLGQQRFNLVLLGGFAGLALLLSAVGLYGVISFTMTQRTHEFGVRMALGAQRGDILRLVLRHGVRMAGAGVAIGLVAAWGLSRFLESLLYSISPSDPLTYAAISALLVSVALAACWVPARRATRVDPMVALRYE